jgi:hypothetical protein
MKNPLTGADRHLSTQEFWTAMCDPAFVRLSMNYGRIGPEILYCGMPPELVPGFIERVRAQIIEDLQPGEPTWLDRLFGWFKR